MRSTRSRARHREFVKLNCAAIPKELLESELFGHERGAFTGAAQSKKGRLELADGRARCSSTRSATSRSKSQAKLLRAIETGEIERVGGTQHREGRRAAGVGDQSSDLQAPSRTGSSARTSTSG